MLPEEPGFRDATRVERRERNSGLVVVPPVKLAHGQHVANLAVFVCFGAVELSTVDHGGGGGFGDARGEAAHVAQVGLGGDVTCGNEGRAGVSSSEGVNLRKEAGG